MLGEPPYFSSTKEGCRESKKVEKHWFNESEVKMQLTVPTVKITTGSVSNTSSKKTEGAMNLGNTHFCQN